MIEAVVAEHWDGGWWYVVDIVIDPGDGARTPGDIPGRGWCAWYHGDKVLIRTPHLVPVFGEPVPLTYSKPRGRVEGF